MTELPEYEDSLVKLIRSEEASFQQRVLFFETRNHSLEDRYITPAAVLASAFVCTIFRDIDRSFTESGARAWTTRRRAFEQWNHLITVIEEEPLGNLCTYTFLHDAATIVLMHIEQCFQPTEASWFHDARLWSPPVGGTMNRYGSEGPELTKSDDESSGSSMPSLTHSIPLPEPQRDEHPSLASSSSSQTESSSSFVSGPSGEPGPHTSIEPCLTPSSAGPRQPNLDFTMHCGHVCRQYG